MTKANWEGWVDPSVLNYGALFAEQTSVEKSVHVESHRPVLIQEYQPVLIQGYHPEIFLDQTQTLDLGALGQGMLNALAIMDEPGYEQEPVEISDDLLAALMSFDMAD